MPKLLQPRGNTTVFPHSKTVFEEEEEGKVRRGLIEDGGKEYRRKIREGRWEKMEGSVLLRDEKVDHFPLSYASLLRRRYEGV